MVAGDTHVTDPVDTVHHEINSTVCNLRVYKSLWSSVIGKQLILAKEPASQSTQ